MVAVSRRSLLVNAGRAGVAAAIARTLPLAEAADATCPPRSAWSDLAAGLKGELLRPDDPFFYDVCRPSNLRYGKVAPAGIARCTTPEDVQACLKWVRDMALPFAIRSGGHNYAGFSATPGLLIETTRMSDITAVDPKGERVKVQGGALNAGVYRALERLGRTITHGRCDSVGAAGFLLGGGIGFNMRYLGMASDLLESTDVVKADGTRVTADASHERDLFWACRGGGGGNFGVNTSFTLRTVPVESVTVFKLTWTQDLPAVLLDLLTRLSTAPKEFGSKISVTLPSREERCNGVKPVVSILGQLHPSKSTLEAIFGPSYTTATKVVHTNVPYWKAQEFLGETTFPYFYQEKSSYLRAKAITAEVVRAMFDLAARKPDTAMATAFKFFQVGGAVDTLPAGETAYVHRGYDWLFAVEANWWEPTDTPDEVEAILAWQRAFYDDTNTRAKGEGAFQNFSDPTLPDWQTAYYGANYTRLKAIKRSVDGEMVFNFPQAIRPG